MKRDPVVLIVIAIVISVMLVFGIQKARHNPTGAGGAKLLNQPAPDFALASLDGKTLKLSDYHGKAVLLNFWATWCEPCKIEMPWFVDLQKKYGPQGLQVLGVAMDDAPAKDIAASGLRRARRASPRRGAPESGREAPGPARRDCPLVRRPGR